MTPANLVRLAAIVPVACLSLGAFGDVIYSNDFESGPVGPEWSSYTTLSQHASFSRFNGRYSNGGVTLSLQPVGGKDGNDGGGDDGGETHVVYTLEFDFYAIDSWDGDGTHNGPDRFDVRANADTIFSETFANTHEYQSFRRPDVGPAPLGYLTWEDSIYRDISISYELPDGATSMHLTFVGSGLQGVNDESWGIDNVEVRYQVIPAPASLATAAAGLLMMGRPRRRA